MSLHASHTGTGPRVLLLHSGFCTWVEWRRTIALLEADREVLAPTLPGSLGGPRLDLRDRSMLAALADHVESVLDEAGWDEPVTVMGSSYGGVVGLELAARGRALRVVALAPPWAAPGRGMAYYMALFSPLLTMRVAEPLYPYTSRSRRFTSLFFHQSLAAMHLDAADAAELWRSAGRFPLVDVFRHSPRGGPGMPDLAGLRVPITLVWGTRDPFVPGWMRQRWERALPDADVVRLPGFPHQPHLRDPELVADLLRSRSPV